MVLTEGPDAAAESLRAIRAASKNGLRELRAILNVLRQADDAEPTAPAPGLRQLDALIAGANQAGLPTTLTVTGEPAALPAGVDLAAYRIIQESLTNAIRHAGPATAAVSLTYRAGTLVIQVADTGRGVPPVRAKEMTNGHGSGQSGPGQSGPWQPGSGHGLVGMRERAATAGGTLEAGPAPGGGVTVTAALPFGRSDEPANLGQPASPGQPAERAPQANRSGASGFLVKDSEPAELIQAVRVVARGDALLSPSVTRKLITDLASRPDSHRATGRELDGLTEREREVMTLVAAGLSNDEIAGRLYVSPLTAKTHVSRIMTKLNARDRAQLVVMAYECGLVIPGQRAVG